MKRKIIMIAGIWLAGAGVVGSGALNDSASRMLFRSVHTVHAAREKTDKTKSSSVQTPQPSVTENTTQDSQGAGSADSELSAAQKKKNDMEAEKSKLESQIDKISAQTKNVSEYVKSLDMQMNRLLINIDNNRKAIQSAKEELEAVNQELADAQAKQDTQYQNMKLRIKNMYESSSDSYLKYLMESQSLADLFSREEYVERITQYDKNLLTQYQSVLMEVTIAQRQAQDKLDEMQATRDSLVYEKKMVQRLIKEKNRQVKSYQKQLSTSQQGVNDYAQQIAQLEAKVETLMQRQRDKIKAQEAGGGTESKIVIPTSGDYAWPLTVRGRITSTFGFRKAPTAGASSYHKGVDIAVNTGSTVLAAKAGKVVTATYSTSAGNYIAIYHGGGTYTYYMHCSRLNVSAGDKVEKGQVIAKSGSTGVSTGPHLHFAIYKNGNYVNPMFYVSQP